MPFCAVKSPIIFPLSLTLTNWILHLQSRENKSMAVKIAVSTLLILLAGSSLLRQTQANSPATSGATHAESSGGHPLQSLSNDNSQNLNSAHPNTPLEIAPSKSNQPPPPPVSKSKAIPFTLPPPSRKTREPTLNEPMFGPDGKPDPLCANDGVCLSNWDLIQFSETGNDYGGTFVAQNNNIGGWGCSIALCTGLADEFDFIPMNIGLGTSESDTYWFQFGIHFQLYCGLGICEDAVQWDIQENIGNCVPQEVNIQYNSNGIGISYTGGHSYEWHFYPDSNPNQMVFLVKDDSTGDYWYKTFNVPSENVLYNDETCFSPSVGIETHLDGGEKYTTFTGLPTFQFMEGNLLCDQVCGVTTISGSNNAFLVTCDYCTTGGYSPIWQEGVVDGYSLGEDQSFLQLYGSGYHPLWGWNAFPAGTLVPVQLTFENDASTHPLYYQAPPNPSNDWQVSYQEFNCSYCGYYVDYEADLSQTYSSLGCGCLTIPTDPNTYLTIPSTSTGSDRGNSNIFWCFYLSGGVCGSFYLDSDTGASYTYYYYELLLESPYINPIGGGSPPSSSVSYTTAPTSPGSSDSPLTSSFTLSTSTSYIWTLSNSIVSVPTCLPSYITINPIEYHCGTNGGLYPSERWDTGVCNYQNFAHYCDDRFLMLDSNSLTNINYWHQYLDGFSFSVSDGTTGYTAPPTVFGSQFGTPFSMNLSTTGAYNWFDSGSNWNVGPATLAGSNASERWELPGSVDAAGSIGSSTTINVEYYDEFAVTFVSSPSTGGTISPFSGWFNASSVIPISATANSGFSFSSWSSGTPSITISSLSSASTTAVVNGAGTVTALFTGSGLNTKLSFDSGSVKLGQSVKTTLTISGTPQQIELSHGTLPKGVTVRFAKNSIKDSASGVTDVITISASSTAKPGTYSISITATGANGQKTTIFYKLKVI
jgi:hypothetical protein